METSSATFTCHLCKRRNPITFESIRHLEAHFAQHHFQCLPYVCEQCPQFASGLYPTEGAIIEHMKLVHGAENEYEFKTIIREDTEEKRAKVRAAVEHCLRGCVSSTRSSSVTTTASVNDSGMAEQLPHAPQTSQQPRAVHIVQASAPTAIVTTEAQHQSFDKHLAVNCMTPTGAGLAESAGSGINIAKNGVSRPSAVGSKRNASEAVGSGKGPSVWKIPKKSAQKKGADGGGKQNKDGHGHGHSHSNQPSESAAKGGYNGLNIDGLFEEMEQQQNQRAENGNNRKDNCGDVMDGDQNNNGNNEHCSTNGRDDLVRSPSLASQSSPTKPTISKGLPDTEHLQGFIGSQKSSTLGLVLYKAEKEGRELRSRLRRGQSPQTLQNTPTEDFRNDFLSRVHERDVQLQKRRKH